MIDDSTPIASARLAVPLDALDGVVISSAERSPSPSDRVRGGHSGGPWPTPTSSR